MQRQNLPKNRSIKGATLIEASLTVTAMLLVILFLFDMGRYAFTKAVLSYAAHAALDKATKYPIDVDTTSESCTIRPQECQAFLRSLHSIAAEALQTALRVASDNNPHATVKLLPLEHYFDNYDGTSNLTAYSAPIGFMRPGERLRFQEDPEVIIQHPSKPGPAWPSIGESWASTLDAHPLVVVIEALFDPITPGFPELGIHIKELGFKNSSGYGAGAPRSTPSPAPTRTPTPYVTPTVTPTWDPAVPTPTITPIPTSTPTPDCKCCRADAPDCCFENPMPPSCAEGRGPQYCNSHCAGGNNN